MLASIDYVLCHERAGSIPILAMDPQGYQRQAARVSRAPAQRDGAVLVHRRCIGWPMQHSDEKINLMPPILDVSFRPTPLSARSTTYFRGVWRIPRAGVLLTSPV